MKMLIVLQVERRLWHDISPYRTPLGCYPTKEIISYTVKTIFSTCPSLQYLDIPSVGIWTMAGVFGKSPRKLGDEEAATLDLFSTADYHSMPRLCRNLPGVETVRAAT